MSLNIVKRVCRNFSRNQKGNAALMFGLMVIPFLGIIGMAADYGLALSDKSKLDGAADAAALAAIKTTQSYIQNQSGTRAQAVSAGTAQALTTFKANAGTLAFSTVPTPSIQWTSSAGQTLTANVAYTATMTNAFSKIIGVATTTVQGSSVATVTMPSYINYYIITDASQSMGVGATATDMTNLYNRVIQYKNFDSASDAQNGIGCVFGCHVPQVSGTYTQPDTNENIAHNTAKYGPYINLRIDAAKSAIQSIIGDAITASNQPQPNIIRIGIYKMQQDPTTSNSYIQPVVDPPASSSNFAAMAAAGGPVSLMDLGNNTGGGAGDTNFANSLKAFATNTLPMQGDGSSPGSPLNYVFLITDGLSDIPGCSKTSGHCTGAFDNTLCSQLASKATVGVIYTTYNPIYADQNNPSKGLETHYITLVQPYINSIPINLKSCAYSPSFYFEASDGPSITTGMKLLFQSSASKTRLSQ